jgi:hypothetical protein
MLWECGRSFELGQPPNQVAQVYREQKLLEDTAAEGCRLCQLFLCWGSKDQLNLWSDLLDANKARRHRFISEYTICDIKDYVWLSVECFSIDDPSIKTKRHLRLIRLKGILTVSYNAVLVRRH